MDKTTKVDELCVRQLKKCVSMDDKNEPFEKRFRSLWPLDVLAGCKHEDGEFYFRSPRVNTRVSLLGAGGVVRCSCLTRAAVQRVRGGQRGQNRELGRGQYRISCSEVVLTKSRQLGYNSGAPFRDDVQPVRLLERVAVPMLWQGVRAGQVRKARATSGAASRVF